MPFSKIERQNDTPGGGAAAPGLLALWEKHRALTDERAGHILAADIMPQPPAGSPEASRVRDAEAAIDRVYAELREVEAAIARWPVRSASDAHIQALLLAERRRWAVPNDEPDVELDLALQLVGHLAETRDAELIDQLVACLHAHRVRSQVQEINEPEATIAADLAAYRLRMIGLVCDAPAWSMRALMLKQHAVALIMDELRADRGPDVANPVAISAAMMRALAADARRVDDGTRREVRNSREAMATGPRAGL